MSDVKPAFSFIGLGAMGFGMATNLLRKGYEVTGYDVYEPTLVRFRDAGGLTSPTPAQAVARKEFCVCMVATAQQAQEVLIDCEQPVIAELPRNAALLLCSTVPSSYVQGLQRELAERGRQDILLVDCPVSGGAGRAADGTLSIMVGASDDALKKAAYMLQAMSDPAKLYIVRGGIGAGSNMKMCHQVLAANQILAASEAMGFASRLGLDLAQTAEAIKQSDAWSWMFENRLPRMLDPDFQPLASAVTIITKDTSIITSEARRVRFPTLMTSVAEQQYFAAVDRGFGPQDDSGLIRLYTNANSNSQGGSGSSEEDNMSLVIDLLRGIHLCSAAECLAYARTLGLDLDQVLRLCIDAAGGSKMLSRYGPDIIRTMLGETRAGHDRASGDDAEQLFSIVDGLQRAIVEGQSLKCPLHLGTQALNILQLHSRDAGVHLKRMSLAAVVWKWLS